MFLNSIKKYTAIVSVLLLASCGGADKNAQQGPPPPTPVTVTEVQTTDAVYYDEYPATLAALNQTELRHR